MPGQSTGREELAELFPRLRAPELSGLCAELEELRERTRTFARRELAQRALELDRRAGEEPGYFDWEVVRAGARAGMLRILIPAPAGGAGGLTMHACIMMEELSAACAGIGLIFGAHGLGISPLLLGGGAHWDGVLAQLVASEADDQPELMALAITEPEAGTDVEDPDLLARGRITSRARRVPGGYRLSGTKRFISNGSVARWISVVMPTDPKRAAETETCFLVDTRSPGFAVARTEHKMGQRACPAAELSFDELFVPEELLVGREGDGASETLIVLACSRPPVGAIGTGIARGAYERLRSWLREEAEGERLLGHQHVQLALAQMEEEIHLARQAYMDAAMEVDLWSLGQTMRHPVARLLAGLPPGIRRRRRVRRKMLSAAMRAQTVALLHRTTDDRRLSRAVGLSSLAKARGGDVAVSVTSAALEIAGLRAGPLRVELEKLWRDAKLVQIYEGTNQLNRLEVFRTLSNEEQLRCLPPRAGVGLAALNGAHA
jgi:alkylation response protein AidB-like acyl-CoA dehydrogenase